MPEVLFNFGWVTIHRFGLLAFLSLLLTSFLVWKQARQAGLCEEKVFDVFLLTCFLSFIASRIGFVTSEWAYFSVDFSRVFLINHYAGLSFIWAFGAGIVSAGFISRLLGLEAGKILDILAGAVSWGIVVGALGAGKEGFLLGGLLAGAIGLTWWKYKIATTADLAPLARQDGMITSAYLIYLSGCFLILGKGLRAEEVIFYLAVLLLSLVFFMVKFPAEVLQQIKKHLEAQVAEVQARLKALKKEDPLEDKSRLLDQAAEDTSVQARVGHERVEAMRRQLTLLLVQTRKALAKIKVGKYGICESCGKMIDTDRLAAMPTATLCLDCEKRREK